MAFSEGTLVSGYRILKVLGAGGMGTVYLAANPVLPRQDALKVLSGELSSDPAFRTRFQREADLAATLDHPNIVTVYTRGESDDGHLWIAMQYVAGSDALKELQENRMTVNRALQITGDVAKALDYAHRRNLVHRDVKPANFLLDPDGERALLADFGIARALDDSENLTMTGTVMATVAYAAPESLSGGRIDGRADIYALACSLFMLLTGKTPYASAGGMHAVMAAHLYQPIPRLTDHVPHLPPAIDAVFARGMAKNPDERCQTAREFTDAAAAVLQGGSAPLPPYVSGAGPVSGTVQPPVAPTAPWNTPAPTFTDRAITYPTDARPQSHSQPHLQPHFAPPPPHQSPPPQPAQSPPPQSPPRRRRWPWAAVAAALVVAVVAGTAFLWPNGQEGGFTPQTLQHQHGSTEVATEPHAVAALGPGDGGAVLALGVQPVAIVAPGGRLPSWDAGRVTGDPAVLASIDTATVSAAKPDLIIDTGSIDDDTYAELARIAPTVTRPVNGETWTWRDQLTWIGRMLGRTGEAERLIAAADDRQAEIRAAHPAFAGKNIEVLLVADSGLSVVLADAPIAAYLEGLGFVYSAALKPTGTDVGDVRVLPDAASINDIRTDVRVVVRTDSAAADGGYNGLPRPFALYSGATVIVDAPDLVAAINTVDYGAVEHLDDALVAALARQVH
ncbi:serine/threonine-protein kinase [Mycolicibacterium confluentis]|uniref:non-specific serine/threonine protein kinase n=1 Tax=Mycolicibacterium confluentis TaxID=28047 RepID=A0A7I7Y0L4_9MYCO|nr:serine/threonine-protein kinase [Mycolicibacterium confluentis]MCV7320122.1 protein kinase [Mycolicibacterium confluentis]ORV34655.1 hypothetical protein AWB99_03410 [Mycolicibacterium confluentis]BBZ35156.1 hypothetical protein MCNF_37610 [Mycolicibacterium confluentis]